MKLIRPMALGVAVFAASLTVCVPGHTQSAGQPPEIRMTAIEVDGSVRDLQVKGWLDDRGFHIGEVLGGSPLLTVSGSSGKLWQLERGDVISHIDGRRVTNPENWARGLHMARNPKNCPLRVQDSRTGRVNTVYTSLIAVTR